MTKSPWLMLLLFWLKSLIIFGQVELIKDINSIPYNNSSSPEELTRVSNKVFFTADVNFFGRELWVTDGTSLGTMMVKDINRGILTSLPKNFIDLKGLLIFTADDGENGVELWRSDGTSSGTYLIKDIANGNGSSSPSELTAIGDVVFFVANDGVHRKGLWKTDGKGTGTSLVKEILTNSIGSLISFTNVGGFLYFIKRSNSIDELWKSDGTSQGTVAIKSFPANKPITNLTDLNGMLFFKGYSETNGYEVWKSNGTSEGTILVSDINVGSSSSFPDLFTTHKGALYFTATDNVHGIEIWKTDGSGSGTEMVFDRVAGAANGLVRQIVSGPSEFFFATKENQTQMELWKSDGTEVGTSLVKQFSDVDNGLLANADLTFSSGLLYFSISKSHNLGLWVSDGTTAGTQEIGTGINPFNLVTFIDQSIIFAASDDTHSTEPWISDGSQIGTKLLRDISFGNFGSSASNFFEFGEKVFFGANDGIHGSELWTTDGSSDGTVLFLDLDEGSPSGSPSSFINFNEEMYFKGQKSGLSSVWRSNGAMDGTESLFDLDEILWLFKSSENFIYFFEGFPSKRYRQLFGSAVTVGSLSETGTVDDAVTLGEDIIYSMVNDSGSKLWRVDDSPSSIILTQQKSPLSSIGSLKKIGKEIYFVVNTGTTYELWKTDGTTINTVKLKEISQHTLILISPLVAKNDRLYFIVNDRFKDGIELWVSDGSIDGTKVISEVKSGMPNSYYVSIVNIDDNLYFSADNGVNGLEPWVSDGTENGTHILKDINPGVTSSYSFGFKKLNGSVYFIARDINGLDQIWKTDGTDCGTMKVCNGNNAIRLEKLGGLIGGKILIEATSQTYGSELFGFEITNEPTALICQSIDFQEIDSKTEDDAPFFLSATATSGLEVSYETQDTDKIRIDNNKVTILNSGEVTISAFQAGDETYNSAPTVSKTFCINPIAPTITAEEQSGSIILNSSAAGLNRWYLDGDLIDGQTGNSLEPTIGGNYQVKTVTEVCESDFSESYPIVITGIEEFGHERNFKIYPNPSSNTISIDFRKGDRKEIKIFSSDGHLVRSMLSKNHTLSIDLSGMSSGSYLMVFYYDGEIFTSKFIKN